jgi:hypothetical protein
VARALSRCSCPRTATHRPGRTDHHNCRMTLRRTRRP